MTHLGIVVLASAQNRYSFVLSLCLTPPRQVQNGTMRYPQGFVQLLTAMLFAFQVDPAISDEEAPPSPGHLMMGTVDHLVATSTSIQRAAAATNPCFPNKNTLRDAVEKYVDQDCSSNSACAIGKT